MKLVLKTLAGKLREVEVSNDSTVKDIKECLKEEYDLTSLKIRFKDKVVSDDTKVDSFVLTPKDNLIIIGRKVEIAKAAEALCLTKCQEAVNKEKEGNEKKDNQTTTEEQKEKANSVSSISLSKNVEGPTSSTCSTSSPGAGEASNSDHSNAHSTSEQKQESQTVGRKTGGEVVNSDLIDSVVAMGFEDREQVALALQAACMNVERAVEYLCPEIPEDTERMLQESLLEQQVLRGNMLGESSADVVGADSSPLRAALYSLPRFREIQLAYQENPNAFPFILEQLRNNNAELYEQIMENSSECRRIMDEVPPIQSNSLRESNESSANSRRGNAGGSSGSTGFYSGLGDTDSNLPEQISIETTLTPEDEQAITELTDLGAGQWDQYASKMVYFAYRKNKEVAGAVLFENGGIPPELVEQIFSAQHGS